MHLDSKFWAGTEETLASYIQSMKWAETATPPKMAGGILADVVDPNATPRLLSIVGNVAVVSVKGTLVNNDSWMNEYRGMTGYPEIREAMVHAANLAEDGSVGAILLDVNSGGGSVSGLSDIGELIASIDKKIVPVHAFTDSAMMSAAYWIGSSARSITVGKVAEVGSIGVLTVHKEVSKMLKDEGIGVTVIRAGEFKALGNPYEALSEKGQAEMQAQVDQLYGMFIDQVSASRDVPYAQADKKMGQGRVFIGDSAVDIGLADKVGNFDSVMAKLSRGIDAKKKAPQYGANIQKGISMKSTLTEKQLAAAALGAGDLVEKTEAEVLADTAAAQDALSAAVIPKTEPKAAATPADAPADIVQFLKTSLSEAQASVTALTIEVRDLKTAAASLDTSHAPMRAIAAASVRQLRVALDRAAGGEAEMSDDALLAEHLALRTQFESKFKAGGVAAVASPTDTTQVEVSDGARQARLQATRSTK